MLQVPPGRGHSEDDQHDRGRERQRGKGVDHVHDHRPAVAGPLVGQHDAEPGHQHDEERADPEPAREKVYGIDQPEPVTRERLAERGTYDADRGQRPSDGPPDGGERESHEADDRECHPGGGNDIAGDRADHRSIQSSCDTGQRGAHVLETEHGAHQAEYRGSLAGVGVDRRIPGSRQWRRALNHEVPESEGPGGEEGAGKLEVGQDRFRPAKKWLIRHA